MLCVVVQQGWMAGHLCISGSQHRTRIALAVAGAQCQRLGRRVGAE